MQPTSQFDPLGVAPAQVPVVSTGDKLVGSKQGRGRHTPMGELLSPAVQVMFISPEIEKPDLQSSAHDDPSAKPFVQSPFVIPSTELGSKTGAEQPFASHPFKPE